MTDPVVEPVEPVVEPVDATGSLQKPHSAYPPPAPDGTPVVAPPSVVGPVQYPPVDLAVPDPVEPAQPRVEPHEAHWLGKAAIEWVWLKIRVLNAWDEVKLWWKNLWTRT